MKDSFKSSIENKKGVCMKYYTGNDRVSLINVGEDLSIGGITMLSMGLNGNIFLDCIIRLKLFSGDREISLKKGYFEMKDYWIPRLKLRHDEKDIEVTLLAPKGMRGFMYNIKGENIRAELKVEYGDFFLNINNPHKLAPVVKSGLNEHFRHGIFSFTVGGSILALAAGASKQARIDAGDGRMEITDETKNNSLNFYFGLGCEEMAASSCITEFERRGFDKYDSELSEWLEGRVRTYKDKNIERIYNTNLFFAYFFGYGITIDTEELVAVTSRSPEYYVSGAYWDRDTLLWSFPAILIIDKARAREILEYVFRVQGRNFGVHSRFINGSTLEYGFELDELCAPFIALESYIRETGDKAILEKDYFSGVIENSIGKFAERKHPDEYIFRTELRPSDDMVNYEYNTYDNMLVWKAFLSLEYLLKLLGRPDESKRFLDLADKVKKALKKYACLKDMLLAYEFDMKGNYILYEEPAGSLRLLSLYGFVDRELWEYYENTLAWIYSEKNEYFYGESLIKESGCLHAAGPWALSAANSLFTPGYEKYGIDFFKTARMDNYYASESVNPESGEAKTGRAFATCAGFIAYAIATGYKE
jgi:uncharacterized protein